jgi:hypothetical protein
MPAGYPGPGGHHVPARRWRPSRGAHRRAGRLARGVPGGVPSAGTPSATPARENAVATDLHVTDSDAGSGAGKDTVEVPARTHRRRAVLLLGLALFQFWLWGTRIVNLLEDVGSFSAAFVAVHLVLYLAAIGAGVLLAVLGTRMWREARAGTTR